MCQILNVLFPVSYPVAQHQKLAAEIDAVIAEGMAEECISQDERYEHYFGQYTVDMPCGNMR